MRVRSESYLWRLYLFKFFTGLHFISGVLIPFFTQWGGLSFTQIMILQSWFMVWIFVFEIPTGSIADHFGRKFSLATGCIISIIAALTYASVPNFYVFLLAEFLWALGATLFSGAYEALVYDTLKYLGKTGESKKVFGRSESFGLLGITIGAPIGSVIAGMLGLRAPMLLMLIPLSIALLISLTFREPRNPRRGRDLKSEAKKCVKKLKEGVAFFCRNKELRILAADMISIRSVAYFMIWLYQPMLQQAGVPIYYFGVVHAVFVLTQIAIMNHYETLERVLGSKKR
ncbi:MFS transporter, partial [bacterium]|nr:MFS transporter [bacterium]